MRLLAFLVAVTATTIFCRTSSASVTISIYIPVPYNHFTRGDFDVSGFVDDKDLSIWKASVGHTGWSNWQGTNGDANNDLVVDGSDFLVWQRNAGNRAGLYFLDPSLPAVPAATVPEPSAAVLAGGAIAWVASSRRRRKQPA